MSFPYLSLMRPNWPKLASLKMINDPENDTSGIFSFVFSRIISLRSNMSSLQLVLVPRGDRKTCPNTSLQCKCFFLVLCNRGAHSRIFEKLLMGP